MKLISHLVAKEAKLPEKSGLERNAQERGWRVGVEGCDVAKHIGYLQSIMEKRTFYTPPRYY